MKTRCYNPRRPNYKNYGGRGIKVCDEWLNDSEKFIAWALKNGFKQNLMMDRIDNNDNYSPENCRWVTPSESSLNRRDTTTNLEKGTRICAVCKIKKPLNEFYKANNKPGGRGHTCKKCYSDKYYLRKMEAKT